MMAPRTCLIFLFLPACFSPVTEGTTEAATDSSGTASTAGESAATGDGPATGQTSAATTDHTTAVTTTATTPDTAAETTAETGASTSTSGTDDTTGAPPDCDLKLDVVFLVSRGDGMLSPQEKLRDAYAGFFDTLQAGASLDLRVMVTDIDRVLGAEKCVDEFCPQNNNESCAPLEPAYPCNHAPTDCDPLYGASVYYPIGVGAANVDCGFAPFLESLDAQALDCALSVGEGTNSVDFGGTIAGLLGPTNEPCNGGFVRDGAALAMIIVTNGDDSSFTNAPQWIADTMDKRSPESMMIAALTGADAPKIAEYVAAFPFTVSGDVEAESYAAAMSNAGDLALESFCSG